MGKKYQARWPNDKELTDLADIVPADRSNQSYRIRLQELALFAPSGIVRVCLYILPYRILKRWLALLGARPPAGKDCHLTPHLLLDLILPPIMVNAWEGAEGW